MFWLDPRGSGVTIQDKSGRVLAVTATQLSVQEEQTAHDARLLIQMGSGRGEWTWRFFRNLLTNHQH